MQSPNSEAEVSLWDVEDQTTCKITDLQVNDLEPYSESILNLRSFRTLNVIDITVQDYYVSLRSFFAWMEERRIIVRSPFTSIPKPTVHVESKHALLVSQIDLLFQAVAQSISPSRDIALLSLLLDTGCRVSEVVTLTIGNMDLETGRIHVTGKGDKKRTVFITSKTAVAIEKYLISTGRDTIKSEYENSFLFCGTRTGTPVTRSGIQQVLKRLARRAGIRESCSPHAFRRSFAVLALRSGASTFAIQEALGHCDLEMTKVYCRIAQSDVEEQHRLHSPMNSIVLPD